MAALFGLPHRYPILSHAFTSSSKAGCPEVSGGVRSGENRPQIESRCSNDGMVFYSDS